MKTGRHWIAKRRCSFYISIGPEKWPIFGCFLMLFPLKRHTRHEKSTSNMATTVRDVMDDVTCKCSIVHVPCEQAIAGPAKTQISSAETTTITHFITSKKDITAFYEAPKNDLGQHLNPVTLRLRFMFGSGTSCSDNKT
jgi:hypothetical protein